MIIPLEGVGCKKDVATKQVVNIVVDRDKILVLKDGDIISLNSKFVYEPVRNTLSLLAGAGSNELLLLGLLREGSCTNGISRCDVVEYLQTIITGEVPTIKDKGGMSKYLDSRRKIEFLKTITGKISFL